MGVYEPPSTDYTYMNTMCSLIETITCCHGSVALRLVGDLNLLDIDWASKSVQGHQYARNIGERFFEMVDDLGLVKLLTSLEASAQCSICSLQIAHPWSRNANKYLK